MLPPACHQKKRLLIPVFQGVGQIPPMYPFTTVYQNLKWKRFPDVLSGGLCQMKKIRDYVAFDLNTDFISPYETLYFTKTVQFNFINGLVHLRSVE